MGLSEQPWFRRLLVTTAGKSRRAAFDRCSRDVRATQEALLRRILDECRETVFGREHGFGSIRTVADYRRAVALGDFESHRPYVERMMQGEADVLFPGRPIIYNTTSGTTARPKMIPISAGYFAHSISNMNKLWLYSVMRDNPRIYDGRSLSAVSPAEDGVVADGTPYGSVSGLGYRNIPPVLRSTYSFPYAVVCIRDYELKFYAMVRYALEHNITFIISPSPSNLLRLHQTVVHHFADIVKDIREGTLRADAAAGLPDAGRAAALAALKPNPGRSRELEGLMARHGEGLRPRHYWPNLACINLWNEGNFRLVLPRLEGYFPDATVLRAFGYQASEARAGLVFGNDWDYSALAVHVYHFEFFEESPHGSPSATPLLAHEVEKGRRYYLTLSNGSGLYRYDINDIVEVAGFYNRTPLIRFVQKGEGVTSLTGEKLSEAQVIQAVSEAGRETGVAVEHFTMVCDEKELVYKLFVEYGAATPAPRKAALADAVDRRLRAINPEYEAKRGSRRLHAPQAFELCTNAHELVKEGLVSRGSASVGQYKDLYLTRKPVVLEILEELEKRRLE
jgi:hypothetical protein